MTQQQMLGTAAEPSPEATADALFRAEFERRAAGRFMLRAAVAADAPFLRELFARTQAEAFQRAGAQAELLWAGPLVDLQFDAQRLGYEATYPRAHHYIGERAQDGRPVGRMLIDWSAAPEVPVVGIDVAVLPGARGGALGLQLLRAWVATCDRLRRAAHLHVMPDNPARLIYRRLGFVETAQHAFPVPMLRRSRAGPR